MMIVGDECDSLGLHRITPISPPSLTPIFFGCVPTENVYFYMFLRNKREVSLGNRQTSMDLALNNLQWLICHKNQTIPNEIQIQKLQMQKLQIQKVKSDTHIAIDLFKHDKEIFTFTLCYNILTSDPAELSK